MTAPTEQEAVELAVADIEIPERAGDDHATLAAWYFGGMTSHCEYWRKVIQAQCREIVRAKYALAGDKITESRLDDLARLHPGYVSYLTEHLSGRIAWEAERLKQGIGS